MTVNTTIGVSKEAKEAAKDAKRANETWDDYLQRCTETPPEIVELVPVDASGGDSTDGLTYDDAVQAARKAIREELPDGALR